MPRLLILALILAAGWWALTGGGSHRLRLSSGPTFGTGPIMGGAAGSSVGGAAVGLAGKLAP